MFSTYVPPALYGIPSANVQVQRVKSQMSTPEGRTRLLDMVLSGAIECLTALGRAPMWTGEDEADRAILRYHICVVNMLVELADMGKEAEAMSGPEIMRQAKEQVRLLNKPWVVEGWENVIKGIRDWYQSSKSSGL